MFHIKRPPHDQLSPLSREEHFPASTSKEETIPVNDSSFSV